MSRYNTYATASSTKPSSSNLKSERNDERASQSGSEDGNYALFSEAHKLEADLEGEYTADHFANPQINASPQMSQTLR
jgi:hypothetical protein